MRAILFGVLAGVMTQLAQGEVALACGATAPPYLVVDQQTPTDAATPLNTPIVVTVREQPDGPVFDAFIPTLTLFKAGSDQAIELKAFGGAPTLAWVPVTPLKPETTYEAHFNPGYEGIPDTVWPFTTGTESTPALSLEGQLEVTFEPGTDTVQVCASNCGGGCTESGQINVTKARVKIPRAIAGFSRRSGTLWLTDDKPFDFATPSKTQPAPYQGYNVSRAGYADLDDPSVTEVLITLPDEETAYTPCFAFAATDARGDQVTSQPLCLDPPAAHDALDPNEGFGNDIVRSPNTRSGCSFGRPEAHRGAWLAALGLLALARGRRRRWVS